MLGAVLAQFSRCFWPEKDLRSEDSYWEPVAADSKGQPQGSWGGASSNHSMENSRGKEAFQPGPIIIIATDNN